MVNVSKKQATKRRAIARSTVLIDKDILVNIEAGKAGKGNPFEVARLAGIMGAKKTAELIPLCHPLSLDHITVTAHSDAKTGCVTIEAECITTGKTGVEMEAMTAVSIAALTFYDMCKALDHAITISTTQLILKEGGRSGRFERK